MADTPGTARKGRLFELIAEVLGSLLTFVGVKEIMKQRLTQATTEPAPHEQDEAIWNLTLMACRREDEREAKENAGGDASDADVEKPMPLHTYASLLVDKMTPSQKRFFIKVIQSMFKLKVAKPEADKAPDKPKGKAKGANEKKPSIDGHISECVGFLRDLRSAHPNPEDGARYLQKQNAAAMSFVDRVVNAKLVQEVYGLIKDLSWEDAQRALRNWPEDVDTLEKFCLAIEGWTKRTTRKTAAKKAQRLAADAELAATPLLRRRSTWWITLSVALALAGSCLLAIKIDLQRWSAISNPQRFGTELPSYLERSQTEAGAVAAQRGEVWTTPEFWLLFVGLVLAVVSMAMLKSIKPAAAQVENKPFAPTPQMRTVETELVTEEDTGLWLDAQRRRRRITREISRQEVPVDGEESTEEGDGDDRR